MATTNDILEARESADALLAHVLGVPLAKAIDLSTVAGFDRAVAVLATRLRGVAAADERRAVRDAVAVLDVDWARTTPEQRRQLVAEAMNQAGRHVRAIPARLGAPLGQAAVEVVNATRTAARRRHQLAIGVEMNALDRRIVRHVARSQVLFVTDAYGRRLEELGARAKEVVVAGLEAGHGRADIAVALAAAAEGALTGRSRFYWEVVAGAFVGRARSFAQVSSYAEAGIERYRVQAVLDEATTPTCRFLHGKTFAVRTALADFDRLEGLARPEDVKAASPWIRMKNGVLFVEHTSGRHELADVVRSGVGSRDDLGEFRARMDDADLGALGIGPPPYHGLCRSTSTPLI